MKVIPEDKEVSPTKSSPIQKSIVQYKANDDGVEDGHDDEVEDTGNYDEEEEDDDDNEDD